MFNLSLSCEWDILIGFNINFDFACCVVCILLTVFFIPLKTRLLDSIVHPPRGDGHHRLCLCLCHRRHRALLLLLSGKTLPPMMKRELPDSFSCERRTKLLRRTWVQSTRMARRTDRWFLFLFINKILSRSWSVWLFVRSFISHFHDVIYEQRPTAF